MATETVDRRSGHHRSMVVTTLASMMGVAAAMVAEFVLAASPTGNTGVLALAGAVLLQFPVLHLAGFDVEEFSTKDYLYVVFMTFSLWFVSWTLLLTAGA